jgi:hypothetical protein
MGERSPKRRQEDGRVRFFRTLRERKARPSRIPCRRQQMANRSPLASSRRSIERLRLRTKGMDFLDLFPRDIKKYIAQGNPRPSSLYCDVSDEIIRTISVSGEGRMSRLTKPSVIFRERVVPAYSEYLKDPLSERRANTLAEALNNRSNGRTCILTKSIPLALTALP